MSIEIHEDAVLDEFQKKVIAGIEPFTTGLNLIVTRGHTSPLGQLAIIEQKAKAHKIAFPEFQSGNLDEMVDIPGVGLRYRWQRVHSRLLHIGEVVNPPRACTVLESYVRPSGEEMKGKILQPSPHIKDVPTEEQIEKGDFEPCPIDFSQRVNGVPNLKLAVEILNRAKKAMEEAAEKEMANKELEKAEGPYCGIKFIKPEEVNGCAHADLAFTRAKV